MIVYMKVYAVIPDGYDAPDGIFTEYEMALDSAKKHEFRSTNTCKIIEYSVNVPNSGFVC
jgi:hypothetical protein